MIGFVSITCGAKIYIRTVRKDDFKLEGGELFKGVFANFSKLE